MKAKVSNDEGISSANDKPKTPGERWAELLTYEAFRVEEERARQRCSRHYCREEAQRDSEGRKSSPPLRDAQAIGKHERHIQDGVRV
jgi:hypothetical protein